MKSKISVRVFLFLLVFLLVLLELWMRGWNVGKPSTSMCRLLNVKWISENDLLEYVLSRALSLVWVKAKWQSYPFTDTYRTKILTGALKNYTSEYALF